MIKKVLVKCTGCSVEYMKRKRDIQLWNKLCKKCTIKKCNDAMRKFGKNVKGYN